MATTIPCGDPPYCTCPTAWWAVVPPPPCPMHSHPHTYMLPRMATVTGASTDIPLSASALSDADVDRIARRVVELLRSPIAAGIDDVNAGRVRRMDPSEMESDE